MTDSGIKETSDSMSLGLRVLEDICSDPQFAILKVEQKFQALMDDEQAEESRAQTQRGVTHLEALPEPHRRVGWRVGASGR